MTTLQAAARLRLLIALLPLFVWLTKRVGEQRKISLTFTPRLVGEDAPGCENSERKVIWVRMPERSANCPGLKITIPFTLPSPVPGYVA